jgi:hypothetical protein
MSHNITEVDEFTTPVVVPDGTDDHMLLSSYILAFVQALTNRTLHVKNVADTAVQRDGGNTINNDQDFTGNVEIEGTLTVDDSTTITGDIHHHGVLFLERANADEALIQTHREPNQSPNPAGNKWDAVSQFKNAGGLYVYTYTGQNGDTLGSYIITTNAVWHTGTQQWSLQNSGLPASAIIWRYQDVRFVGKPASSSPWSSWPTDEISGGTDARSEHFYAQEMFSDTYSYRSPGRLRTQTLDLALASGDALINSGNGQLSSGSGGYVYLPLKLPRTLLQFGSIEIVLDQATASPAAFRLVRQHYDWGGPPASVTNNYPTNVSTGGATGLKLVTLDCSGETYDPNIEYRLVFVPGNTGDAIQAARIVDFLEAGPEHTY